MHWHSTTIDKTTISNHSQSTKPHSIPSKLKHAWILNMHKFHNSNCNQIAHIVNEVKMSKRERERERVRGDVDIADFAAVGFIGFDVDATVGIPEANGAVFAATETIIAVGVEPRGQNGTLVTLQHVHFLPRKIFHAHFFFSFRLQTLSPTLHGFICSSTAHLEMGQNSNGLGQTYLSYRGSSFLFIYFYIFISKINPRLELKFNLATKRTKVQIIIGV